MLGLPQALPQQLVSRALLSLAPPSLRLDRDWRGLDDLDVAVAVKGCSCGWWLDWRRARLCLDRPHAQRPFSFGDRCAPDASLH